MLIYVDIDGTICHTEGGYDNAKPDYDDDSYRIEKGDSQK